MNHTIRTPHSNAYRDNTISYGFRARPASAAIYVWRAPGLYAEPARSLLQWMVGYRTESAGRTCHLERATSTTV